MTGEQPPPAEFPTALPAAGSGPRADMAQKRKLFVCGCPRSGGSAVLAWLTRSRIAAIGLERYQTYWRNHLRLPPDAFTTERFFDIRTGDTWYEAAERFSEHYRQILEFWPKANYVGDKIPGLWRNLPAIVAAYPNAKLIYTYRDPFSVARSYKNRSLQKEDQTWGRQRDVLAGIQEWNESVAKLVEFFHSNSAAGQTRFHRCLVIEYEKFISNASDRRLLSRFLEVAPHHLPIVDVSASRRSLVELTEIEKELVWSVLDTALVAEMHKIIGTQQFELARASVATGLKPVGRREWYHTEDKNLAEIEYGDFQPPGCPYVFRGRSAPLDMSQPYAVCIGSATTFGRFLRRPYPTQLEEATGVPFVNLGIGGARPEVYLSNANLMDFLRRSGLVVLELMSARGYPSPIYAPSTYAGNIGTFMDCFGLSAHRKDDAELDQLLTKTEAGEMVFVDRVFEGTFKYLNAEQRDLIRDVLVLNYLRDIRRLAGEIGVPIVGLLMTKSEPFAARARSSPKNYPEWAGDYPHFVDDAVVEALVQSGISVAVSRSVRGVPFPVTNWRTGEPAPVFRWQSDPSLNTYYPSQEMHDDATRVLLDSPAVQLFSRAAGGGRSAGGDGQAQGDLATQDPIDFPPGGPIR